ncbi:magnesium transporter NIPA-domain-containing protein [Geopyxis carbonaria]|nr:magnesium transporter NIPA-domain-containing protein [Geopyxis carbonaria]
MPLLLPSSTTIQNYTQSTNIPSSGALTGDVSPLRWFLVEVVQTVDTEENLKRWSSFIGICIAVAGNVLISLALNVQKYAHTRLEREAERRRAGRLQTRPSVDLESPLLEYDEDEGDTPRNSHENDGEPDETSGLLQKDDDEDDADHNYIASPYWWAGLVMMFFGECGNFLAYGFAPASIVSPLGVVALVSNCVIAPVMLKEPFRGRDVLGVLVSIAGAVTVVWSAEKEEVKLGPDEILQAISQTAFEVYFGITCAMIVGLMYCSNRYGHKSICIDLGLVALFGGYTVLSTKGISSLISSSFYHIFQYPIAYLFTFVLASTAILQVKYVNRALQRFDSTQVIPTQFVLFTMSVIVGSAILYRDFETVSQDRFSKFASGCILTFIGVYLISSLRDPPKPSPRSSATYPSSPSSRPTLPKPTHHDYPRPPLGARTISQLSSTAVSLSSTPALSTSPPPPPTPARSKRPSESAGTPVNLIPGVMAGYQLGGVIKERVSGTMRKSSVVPVDEEGAADASPRGRSSSLSVVLDFVKGKKRDGAGEGGGA